ncbi:ComEC/Rec2 family competence protein [Haloflavibacter putidus]|uniref:ComEC/Rec2 family competence protein n=1 Tax=Haloflavibacter putidus TaxID=2576776 RepID=A0A507ZMP4_9FLAO|nr:ComEC/Rec2 family competence protein [Haloflavibacter putidus]TQD38539.1 ComEC/Rec2 family competence protein [Haloflavibacter putidus]
MKLLNPAILLLCFSFIIGIILCLNFNFGSGYFWFCFAASFLVFLGSFIRTHFLLFQDRFFAGGAVLAFICLGYLAALNKQPQNNKQHYIHFTEKAPTQASIAIKIGKQLKSSAFYHNYIAEINRLNNQTTQGKILFSVRKDSSSIVYTPGQRLMLNAQLKPVFKSGNPHQFDYRNYLEKQRVLRQAVSFDQENIRVLPVAQNLFTKTSHIRTSITQSLAKNGFSTAHINLIQALILGQKQELSKDVYTSFTEAGVVHVLAVSGLHVGIILYLLYALLFPLGRFRKGKTIRMLIAIILLWLYAALVGFSPSVLRAVTMFSFLGLGLASNRKVFSLNMLALSALVLLIAEPYFIFSVGFQLSYAAVFMIVCFQPKIYGLLRPKNKIVNYFWGIFSVTFTAQIGVLPLSLFYFHQLPGLFFISNLLIVPFLGILLALGILSVFLSLAGILPEFLKLTLETGLNLLLQTVEMVSSQKAYVMKNIYFSELLLVSFYGFLLLLLFYIYQRKKVWLFAFMAGIIMFQGIYIWERSALNSVKKFYVFQQYKRTILADKQHSGLTVFSDSALTASVKKYLLDPVLTHQASRQNTVKPIPDYYKLAEKKLLVIDSLGVYPKRNFPVEYLLLRNSPKINLERALQYLQPTTIIADGSNYRSYIKRWKKTCNKKKLLFYNTTKKGAFVIEY